MAVQWPDRVDEILGGDHVVMLAYVTPASGVVLLPVSNFAVRDRSAGTLSALSSSVGLWRKLERIRRNPQVALAYHTREHSASADRPEYVLVQGTASLSEPIADYPSTILEQWERFEPWAGQGRFWKWWRRVYGLRVEILVTVERVVVWPDLGCRGAVEVHGVPLPPEAPVPQSPPKKGTGPRIDAGRTAARAAGLPDALLGWVGADGFPMVVPVGVAGSEERGVLVEPPPGVVPAGGRRAALTAHWFSRGVIGQNQRKHTGWLEAEPAAGQVVYAPHTDSSYRFPSSLLLYRFASGAATRRGLRGARGAGFVPEGKRG